MVYDQTKEYYTRNWCWVYALCNLLAYDFWVEAGNDKLIQLLQYLEEKWAWLVWYWMSASVWLPLALSYINWKLWLNIQFKKETIPTMESKYWYIIGFKQASKVHLDKFRDWTVTKWDFDIIKQHKWSGHFLMWKRGVIIDSLWDYHTECKLETLKYWYKLDLFYPAVRRVTCWDDKTLAIQKQALKIVKNTGKLMDLRQFRSYFKLYKD